MELVARCIIRTRNWIQDFVIGLQLCPFAKDPFQKNQIRYRVFSGSDTEKLLAFIYAEFKFLESSEAREIETTLILIPEMIHDFEQYLSIIDLTELLLEDLKLEGIYQVASFHPKYQFANTHFEDITNYTNRSPYPTIHLLRESSVEAAIQSYGDTSTIPERNKKLLQSMDESVVKELCSGKSNT